MLETIEEIIKEKVEHEFFIKDLEEFFRLGNKVKKHLRGTSQTAWNIILNDSEEDFPYIEVKK